MMLNRRRLLLSGLAAACAQQALPARALSPMPGALDPARYGVRAGALGDQGAEVNALLRDSAAARVPVFLPAGDYLVSRLDLPDGTVLGGVGGRTRLVLASGEASCLVAREAGRIEVFDLMLDGGGRRVEGEASDGEVSGLIDFRGVREALIDSCILRGAGGNGIHAERCGGWISRTTITGAALAGLYAVDSSNLSIESNVVSDCGNGGILVHRWEEGEDGTLISGNRVTRIAATAGGTGENGNGINLYRAANVIVTSNHVSDCAFSAIRANAASDVLIASNQCLRSGETAIYSEFGFQGAVVSGNLIGGAANGILIVNFDVGGRLASVTGNIVRNLTTQGPYRHDGAGFGIGIAAEADTVVADNVIESAPKWGLMLGWGPYLRDVVATGNIVRDAGGGCAVSVVEGAGAALISDNLFAECRDGAVLGYRWNERATGDLALDGAEAFAHLTIEGNRV